MAAVARLGLLWGLLLGTSTLLGQDRLAGRDKAAVTPAARCNVPSPAFVTSQTVSRKPTESDRPTAIVPASGPVTEREQGTRSPSNDDCANAITFDLVNGQPVTFCDNNTGATEDCPALSGGAYREVWYKFTTTETLNVTVKYCGTTPAFYNAYIVFDTACPCSGAFVFATSWENSSCGDGNWTLVWNNLAAGTYYWPLLTDSAGGYAEGPYCVTFSTTTPPPAQECPPNTLYGQVPYDQGGAWGAYTSAATSAFEYKCYENFWGLPDKIGDLHWWGLSLFFNPYYGWQLCDPTGMTFNVGFYANNNGEPGTPVCAYGGVAPTIEDKGPFSWAELYYFSLAALQPCCVLPAGWVSVESQVNAPDCAFLWLTSPSGDGSAYQQSGSTFAQLGTNLALCLTSGDCPLIYGACCDDYTGACNDNVEWSDCMTPLRFTPGVICADLTPLCGIRGACCDASLVCLFTGLESECDAVGGRFFPGQTCPEFVCPAECDHRIDLYDCYGDGWNGNTLDVLVNGVTVLSQITLPSGPGPLALYFAAATGDTIQTIYYPIGGWPYEPYYYIYDGLGFLLGFDGTDGTNCYIQPTGITLAGNCSPPTTGACCYYNGGCDMVAPDQCDPAIGLFLGLGHQCIECPCFVPCPPEAIPEPEPCGEDTDGGCGMMTPTFAPIACGDTVCGTLWANTSLRDTDWYQLTLTEGRYLTWSGAAQVPLLLVIIQGAGPNDCSSYTILASATADECQTATIGPLEGAPGLTYWFWAGPSAWNNWPCDKHYTATLTCAVVPTGACCLPQGTCIDTTPGDCAAQYGAYQGDNILCADINCGWYYCPGGAQYCDEYISRVQLNEIDNPSGCEAGQYADYTNLSASLVFGQPMPLTVTNGNPIWGSDVCSVWVDWDHDYIWEDSAPELVDDIVGVGPYNFALMPPEGAHLGPTRMRVRIDYANADPEPCGTTYYGEVEDYTVNIGEWTGYCPASGGCDEYIARVQINALDNSSDCTAYGDYTYLSANVPFGATTYITVTNGNPQLGDRATYWIDWDNNGFFADSERGAIRTGNGPYVWSIYPFEVPPGPRRLRIRLERGDSDPQPCGATTYGEVEDYTLNIGGTEPGACCWPDGTCTTEEQAACNSAGGSWGGPVTVCAGNDCNGNGVDDFCDILSGTSADCNSNHVPDECDIANGTSQDCQPNGIPDECELGSGSLELQLDDGTSENNWGLTAGGELCWINHFNAVGTVNAIGVAFGSPANPGSSGVSPGQLFHVYIWGDANGDGIPSGADFIASADGAAEAGAIDTDAPQAVALNAPITVNGSFFIGASINVSAGGYPATADDDGWTGPPDQGFLTFNSSPFDPTNLSSLYPMSALGYPQTVFILRTIGGPGGDCNGNGIPDECDIAGDPNLDCNRNGIPDECEPGGTADCDNDGMTDLCTIAYCEGIPWCSDCNGNQVPDGCDIASGTSLDCNGNGIPDECDLLNRISEDCNHNGIPDECDIASGISCDCQGDGIPDECQLWVGTARDYLFWDDGSSENSLGLTAGGELCWLHHFAVSSPGLITGIQTCFGSTPYPGYSGVSAGQPVRVYVWSDPNGDGNPSDAVFLTEATGTVEAASIDSDVLQTVSIMQPISGSFFVGASVVTSSGYPAPMDQNGPQAHQAWVVFNTVPFNPQNFGPQLYNMDDIGYTCNWLLRAVAFIGPSANDCNADGIPDECDIGVQWGGYCAGQGPPCFPTECSSDWNLNGIPDQPCDDAGDLNYDGAINMDDYWVFIDAFGTCVGDPKYNPAADMDSDGCVTLVDYQIWRIFYKMANGKEFVPPQPKPLTRPGLAK